MGERVRVCVKMCDRTPSAAWEGIYATFIGIIVVLCNVQRCGYCFHITTKHKHRDTIPLLLPFQLLEKSIILHAHNLELR
jgi:hypothetical protein